MNYNHVELAGNITRDIEISYTPSQIPIAKFGLAVNKKINGQDKTMFIDCTAFRDTATNIDKYFQKGSNIFLVGELALDTWEDKKTGQKRSKHSMNVRTFTFVESKPTVANNTTVEPQDDDSIPF